VNGPPLDSPEVAVTKPENVGAATVDQEQVLGNAPETLMLVPLTPQIGELVPVPPFARGSTPVIAPTGTVQPEVISFPPPSVQSGEEIAHADELK
jgi:hypothetical protein